MKMQVLPADAVVVGCAQHLMCAADDAKAGMLDFHASHVHSVRLHTIIVGKFR